MSVALANLTDAGDITLVANATEITGAVLSDGATTTDTSDDTNIEGATVTAIVNGDATMTVVGTTTTDENGAFVLALTPGIYDVTVTVAGWTTQTQSTPSVLPGTLGAGVTFTMAALTDELTGTVTDNAAVAKVGVSMTVTNANGTQIAGPVSTDANGDYTLTGVPSGTHTLTADDGVNTPVTTTITVVGDNDATTSQTVDVQFP